MYLVDLGQVVPAGATATAMQLTPGTLVVGLRYWWPIGSQAQLSIAAGFQTTRKERYEWYLRTGAPFYAMMGDSRELSVSLRRRIGAADMLYATMTNADPNYQHAAVVEMEVDP